MILRILIQYSRKSKLHCDARVNKTFEWEHDRSLLSKFSKIHFVSDLIWNLSVLMRRNDLNGYDRLSCKHISWTTWCILLRGIILNSFLLKWLTFSPHLPDQNQYAHIRACFQFNLFLMSSTHFLHTIIIPNNKYVAAFSLSDRRKKDRALVFFVDTWSLSIFVLFVAKYV